MRRVETRRAGAGADQAEPGQGETRQSQARGDQENWCRGRQGEWWQGETKRAGHLPCGLCPRRLRRSRAGTGEGGSPLGSPFLVFNH